MTICIFLGLVAALLYPASIFVFATVSGFARTSKDPIEGATYWEFSLGVSKRDLPMIIFGYVFAFGIFGLAIYLTFFSCAFSD